MKSAIRSDYGCLVDYMYRPMDPSSLGVIRFLFGLMMLVDLPEERGGAVMDLRWGDPKDCHFPLFPSMPTPVFPYIGILYCSMLVGALGIMLGYKFRLSTILFGVPYWYILLADKSFWNNHSYLYGLVTLLLAGSSANHYFSLDAILDQKVWNKHVPYWNYFVLKFQFFLLYFFAGLKKTDMEWLDGYSVTSFGNHWVFSPFRLFLNTDQVDFLVIHWFGFILDLTIGFWMLYELTRPIAMVFCALFHLMNSRLFSIGMFPYVCLATMPLFCEETWPKKLLNCFKTVDFNAKENPDCIYKTRRSNWKQKFVVSLLVTHCGLQLFLPYSHFITKGYNNWTNGLYGYSWDMMVHSWDTILVVVKVVDNKNGNEHFIDPEVWTLNERWEKHADMSLQYAQCLKRNLLSDDQYDLSSNVSIYIDVWCSLNGRFQQRMYDPRYDLLQANWSVFRPVEWLLPLLSEYNEMREKMKQISQEVYTWSNYSDVLFVADFPGLHLENFIEDDLRNVSLTVLEGEVMFVVDDDDSGVSYGEKLEKGASIQVETGMFHKIYTLGTQPSSYMYTYVNRTRELMGGETVVNTKSHNGMYSPFPIIEDFWMRIEGFQRMLNFIWTSIIVQIDDQN